MTTNKIEKVPTLKQYLDSYSKLRKIKSCPGLSPEVSARIIVHRAEDLECQVRVQFDKIRQLIQRINNDKIQRQFYECLFELSKIIDHALNKLKKNQIRSDENIPYKSASSIRHLSNNLHKQSFKSLQPKKSLFKTRVHYEKNMTQKQQQKQQQKQKQKQHFKQQQPELTPNKLQIQQRYSILGASEVLSHLIDSKFNKEMLQNLQKIKYITPSPQPQHKSPHPQTKTTNLNPNGLKLTKKKSENNINLLLTPTLYHQGVAFTQRDGKDNRNLIDRDQKIVCNQYQIKISKCTSNYG